MIDDHVVWHSDDNNTFDGNLTVPPNAATMVVVLEFSDHLGSTSVMSYGQGQANPGTKVLDSTARYLPFGDWRVEPSHDLTDQGFTGHKHNDDLGLVYMNARFYISGIGRFASADSIVPNPMNPQSYNRYSYVENRPTRMTDPTGHCGADNQTFWDPEQLTYITSYATQANAACMELRGTLESLYKISITGKWTLSEMELLQGSLAGIVARLGELGAGSALDAFHNTWSGVRFNRVRTHSYGRAWTRSKNLIDVHNGTFLDTTITMGEPRFSARSGVNVLGTIAHELAHVWDRRSGRSLGQGLRHAVGGHYENKLLFFEWGQYTVGDRSPYRNGSRNPPNQSEDWAYTFEALMVDPQALQNLNDLNNYRFQYVSDMVGQLDR
jgi:RHS repeat-associated protein